MIAFQEGMHLIVACDTRGLDLMTEKIIFIPESPALFSARFVLYRYAGRALFPLFHLRAIDTRL